MQFEDLMATPSQYLESKVLTAPPQRLHLMLIEGAIRFGRQAEEALRRGDTADSAAPLLRTIDIVGEMLSGVRQQESQTNKRLAEFYWFLFRRLAEAKIHSDTTRLAEALKLLEYERETWQLVCDKLATTAPTEAPGTRSSQIPTPRSSAFSRQSLADNGLSLEV
jgi:flagellar secretion chaperone FliS